LPYSTRFVAVHEDLSGAPVLYTVPSGYVAVLRDVSVRNQTADTSLIQVGATVPGPLNVVIAQFDSVAANDVVSWQGRQVLNAGDELWLYNSEGSAQAIASGYLLSAP
jgi:hypothetical protein